MDHVDLFATRWGAGRDDLAATVSWDGHTVLIDGTDQELVKGLSGGVYDAERGVTVAPYEGLDFLDAVSRKFHDGTYLRATDVHTATLCASRR